MSTAIQKRFKRYVEGREITDMSSATVIQNNDVMNVAADKLVTEIANCALVTFGQYLCAQYSS